jgi:hypothetical protein
MKDAVCQLLNAGRMMNWKGFGRQQTWHNWGPNPAYPKHMSRTLPPDHHLVTTNDDLESFRQEVTGAYQSIILAFNFKD